MIITSNLEIIAREVEEYKKEVRRKLENMVRGFAAELTFKAIEATPLGNQKQYRRLYKIRQPSWLPRIEGFAKGSWQVSFSPSPGIQNLSGRSSGGTAYSMAAIAMAEYSLGKTVYITNKGPYIHSLENGYSGQAPQGIMIKVQAPQIYSINLQYHFDKG